MFYVAVFFAVLCAYLTWLLWQTNKSYSRELETLKADIVQLVEERDELEESADIYWNRSEGYRSNADIFKAERDDALRCLDVVLTEQAERISRELDDAYDSLSMVLAENEKLRVA